ncbi:unnamed protein product [Anisakis simplex]|uniref:Nitroreductase domain-containing protein n=1 Tax=Anisakis simplex TaxID=6269 RepID=A0A0M3IZF9_ANISI|nr:unnamed protein product [Anisakis simplex]
MQSLTKQSYVRDHNQHSKPIYQSRNQQDQPTLQQKIFLKALAGNAEVFTMYTIVHTIDTSALLAEYLATKKATAYSIGSIIDAVTTKHIALLAFTASSHHEKPVDDADITIFN